MRQELILTLGIAVLASVSSVLAEDGKQAPIYERLSKSRWRSHPWCGYRFVFQPYGDNWESGSPYRCERVAHEAEVQKLLTPVWRDPNFRNTHQIPGLHEWAWNANEKKWPGRTKRECYEMAREWYLRERDKRVGDNHWRKKYPGDKKIAFTSMTGHGWLVHGPAEWGMDWLGIEIGENIDATQLHIAFQRGAARMFGLPTHADVSQWYGGTVPDFVAGVDEYTQLPFNREEVLARISKGGTGLHNGGHSSSLMARMWYVCWLSGITVLCPEACQSTFFAHSAEHRGKHNSPWDGYKKDQRMVLSPYGVRAREFYAVTRKHPEIGVPYTPFAVLLDKYSGFFGFHHNTGKPWGVLPIGDGDRQAFDFLNTAFPNTMRKGGTPEHERLVATVCGDTFDVLVTGVTNDLLNMYPVVIILGEHEFLRETVAVLRAYVKAGGRLYLTKSHTKQLGPAYAELRKAGGVELFDNTNETGRKQLLGKLRHGYVPVRVSGKVEYLVNRMPGGWLVGLVNNKGVTKGRLTPTKLDRSKGQNVTVGLKWGQVKSANEWCTDKSLPVEDNAVLVPVPAGEVRIVEFAEH